ncbi:MAG: TVP38/TMEM64 family protein [Chloroflexi bacterium]|nr:TVP38/TMEM64 family protein [Chloroflexota bacterium]
MIFATAAVKLARHRSNRSRQHATAGGTDGTGTAGPAEPREPREAAGGSERDGGRGARVTFLVALATFAAVYLAVPPLRTTINTGVAALDPRDIGRLRDYLLGFGVWAPAVSFLLMVLQSVAAPLPAFVITLANGLLFGAVWGTILSWSSAMVGAGVCFGIAKALGRPVVERLVGRGPLAKADSFFERYGSHSVLIARLIPLISFDIVSYAAGLTKIRLIPFLVATGIGQLPATVIYSVLGENITTGSKLGLWALGALLSLVVVGVAFKRRLDRQPARGASRVADAPASSTV